MYSTIDQAMAANEAAGGTWFGPDEMAFFGTVIVTGMLGGRYFVTADRAAGDGYTVRQVDDGGRVSTLGEFQGHASREDAIVAAIHATNRGD